MNLSEVYVKGVMTASAEMIKSKRLDVDLDEVVKLLKAQTLDDFDGVVEDLRQAQHMGNAMLRKILNTAVTHTALVALQKGGYL